MLWLHANMMNERDKASEALSQVAQSARTHQGFVGFNLQSGEHGVFVSVFIPSKSVAASDAKEMVALLAGQMLDGVGDCVCPQERLRRAERAEQMKAVYDDDEDIESSSSEKR